MGLLRNLGAFLLRLFAPIETRLNPILVKEVRQSLRGRYFSVVFWIMLTLATFIGCVMLVIQGSTPHDDAGVLFFVAIYGCLSVAVHIFVPFAAFLSVGSEWEENTFDLLVLSDLKPRQIISGKLLSAGLQILLFYLAFGPFLVFAFLLRGLDFVGAMWLLSLTLVSSTTLCCIALCLSSLVRARFGRVFCMALLSVLLVWASVGSIAFAVTLFEERFIHTPEFRQAASVFVTCALIAAGYSLALAATRFAHQEENRSTGLRVLTSLTVLAAIGWAAYLYATFRQPEIPFVLGTLILVGVTVSSVLFCTEQEALGRRVRLQVPRGLLASTLAAPFLPGGGRGVLLYWFHVGLTVAAIVLLPRWIPSASARTVQGHYIFMGVLVYSATSLHLVSGLLARHTKELRWRVVARVLIPLVLVLGFAIPTIVGFLLDHTDTMRARHVGNPVWVIVRAIDEDDRTPLLTVAAMAGLAVLLNVPRLLRGFGELARCRKARVQMEATPAASSGARGAVSES